MNIHNMELHESFQEGDLYIIRVPGGWTYTYDCRMVFVPFHKEFLPKAEKPKFIPVDEKQPYGELGQVKMTVIEYRKLLAKHGSKRLEAAIEIVDGWLATSGKKRKNHYAIFKEGSWVWEKVSFVAVKQHSKSLNQITDEAIRAAEMDDLNYK